MSRLPEATAKDFLLPKMNREYIGVYIESNCFDAALPGLLFTLEKKAMKEEAGITVDYAVQEASKSDVSYMKSVHKKFRCTLRPIPGGFVPAQYCPEYLISFISAISYEYSIYDICKMMGPHRWSAMWRQRVGC